MNLAKEKNPVDPGAPAEVERQAQLLLRRLHTITSELAELSEEKVRTREQLKDALVRLRRKRQVVSRN